MNHKSDFRTDLKIGQEAERELGGLLKKYIPGIEKLDFNDNKDYDVKFTIKGKSFTVEVKHDLKAIKTGNIFVEYESRGKRSGIATTKADYWAYKLEDSNGEYFIFLSVEDFKKIARTGRHILGGDNNTSKGVLVPAKAFNEHKL